MSNIMAERMTQAEALDQWGDEAQLCLQCYEWKHCSLFHLDTCRVCLNEAYDEIFIEERRPLNYSDPKLQPHRPAEWPKKWVGTYWQETNWRLTEEELYEAYVALVESFEAFMSELNETNKHCAKVKRAVQLLKHKSLIRYTKKEGWTYND